METSVVNIYHKVPYDVYIGRPGKGQSGYFGNPFSKWDKETNVKKFRDYFHDRLQNDFEFRRKIHALKGKTLGCFCKPKPCHGDVIVEYLKQYSEKPTIYGVVGSRSFTDVQYLTEILNWYSIKRIVSGGARGADRLAAAYGRTKGIDVKEFLPDSKKFGWPAAAFIRNQQIVDASEEIIAFWNGKSTGTADTVRKAQKANKLVHVFWPKYDDEIANLGL